MYRTYVLKEINFYVIIVLVTFLSFISGIALAEEQAGVSGASNEWVWRAKITSEPAGADVYADPKDENKYLGKTPLEIKIMTIILKGKPGEKCLQTTIYHLPVLRTRDGFYCIFLVKKGNMERKEQGFFSNPISPTAGGSISAALHEGTVIRMTGNIEDVETFIPDGFKFPPDLVNQISVDFNKKDAAVQAVVKPKPEVTKPKEENIDINSLIEQLVESRNNSGTLEVRPRGDIAEKIEKLGTKAVPFLIQSLKNKQESLQKIKDSSTAIVQVQMMVELSVLKKITNQDFGNDLEKWQEWWKENKGKFNK
jgi:hypothetical protein